MSRDNRWRPFPASTPRAVENGIKARTARGTIGSTWWSRRFIDVLESFAMGSRLTRGRAYARKGQVVSLDVRSGEVRATVQGSRARPYRVTIGLQPFSELVWAKAEIALSERALPSAALLAGEVPPELEQVFADAGAPLFPRTVDDLAQHCSCPDWEVPCKHLAATLYLLAEAFDADPFLLLRWRGRDREQLLGRLRQLRSGTSAATGRAEGAPRPAANGAALALVGLGGNAADAEHFWLPAAPLPPRPAVLDVDAALLLRQLPPPGAALGGDSLVRRLEAAYERFAAGSQPR